MSDKTDTPKMDPQSDSDKAVMAALGEVSDDIKKGEGKPEDEIEKGDNSPGDGEALKPDGQKKADGGQTEPLKKTDKKKDDEEDEDEEKSITSDDLVKALDTAIAVIGGADPDDIDRRAELAEKLAKSGLDKDESAELCSLLASKDDEADADGDLQKSFAEMAVDDPAIQDPPGDTGTDGAVDVAEFLQRQAAFIGGTMDELAGEIRKGFQQETNSRMALAKGLKAIGMVVLDGRKLMKSMDDRLTVIENQTPGRRSAPTAKAAEQLQRGFGPGSEASDLNKADLVKGLVKLTSEAKDQQQAERYSYMTTQVECGGGVPDDIIQDVRKVLGK